MPYGLVNARSVFQAFINEILWEFRNSCDILYIDNILIYSQSEAEHISQLWTVLRKHLESNLYVKVETWVSKNVFQDEPEQLEAIMSWPCPETATELQSFLGFANFYRRVSDAKFPFIIMSDHKNLVNMSSLQKDETQTLWFPLRHYLQPRDPVLCLAGLLSKTRYKC